MEREKFEQWAFSLRPSLMRQAEGLLSPEEAEDTVQDVLCKLWLLRDRLDAYRSPTALARTMTRHLALNRLRDACRTVAGLDEISALPAPDDGAADDDDLLAVVMGLVAELPDSQQVILRMKHVDGLEVADIARLTGSSPAIVRVYLSRARRKIRELFLSRQTR